MFVLRCLLLIVLLCGLRLGHAQSDEIQSAEEYKLKAAFLYNFGKFVEWPPQVLLAADSTFRICIAGKDPFGGNLRALEGRLQKGRPIEVTMLRSANDLAGCQLLYGDTARDFANLGINPRLLGDLPILTVTSATEGEYWAVIRFVQRGGKLRWELNLDAARKANLKVSAKLIEIAVTVIGSTGP